MTFQTDTPDVRRLLGLKPLPTRCPCCGATLLPVGTKVRNKHYGIGRVSSWASQDHWNLPVTFKSGEHMIVPRDNTQTI